jgi:hypothetical protein
MYSLAGVYIVKNTLHKKNKEIKTVSNIGNIASALVPILFHPPAAGAAAPAAAPQAPAEPGESVSLGQSPQTEAAGAKQPQWKIDGPVQPLAEPTPPKKWTVMVWSCSDNNLYDFMQSDIDEAERIGGSENMNIIVQTDHRPSGGTAKIYELVKDASPQLHSPVRADLGDCDMGKRERTLKIHPVDDGKLSCRALPARPVRSRPSTRRLLRRRQRRLDEQPRPQSSSPRRS